MEVASPLGLHCDRALCPEPPIRLPSLSQCCGGAPSRQELPATPGGGKTPPIASTVLVSLPRGISCGKTQRGEAAGRLKGPRHTETDDDAAVARGVRDAVRRAGAPVNVVPGPTAEDAARTVTSDPRRTIGARSSMTAVYAIRCPFRDVAKNVMQAKRVSDKASNRHGLSRIPLLHHVQSPRASDAVRFALAQRDCRFTPSASLRCILPLGFAQETIGFSSLLG